MALFQYFWRFTQICKKFAAYEHKIVFVLFLGVVRLKLFRNNNNQGVPCICWSFFTGIFLLGGSHLWPYLVNMGTSIIWCDSNIKVQYFSVWLWYTLCSPLMAYHHNDRLHEKVSWLLPNHIPIKLLFLFSTQLN